MILFSVLLSFVVEAIDASVQYRPGEGKADYRKYRPATGGIAESPFAKELEAQEFNIKTPMRSKNDVSMPLKATEEEWIVEPMTYWSFEERSQEWIDKAEKEYLEDKLFPDCEKIEMDNLKSKADEVAALMDWKALEEALKERIAILNKVIALISKLEDLKKKHDELVAKRSELFSRNKHPYDVVRSPELKDISSQIDEVVAQAKEHVTEIDNRLLPRFNSLRSKFVEFCTKVDAASDAVVNTFGKNENDLERLELAAKKTKLFKEYLDVRLKSSKPKSYSRTLQKLESLIKYVGEKGIHFNTTPEFNAKSK